MKVGICVTVFNEEKSIYQLLQSLVIQSRLPDEVVIVDGKSNDKTVEIIRGFVKNNEEFKVKLIVKKCNRARGRNLGIENCKCEVIATTDGDCVAKRNWLKNLVKPFEDKDVDMVAGFYEMKAKNSLEKAMSIFLGIQPSNFSKNFLPSTRSMAFRKSVWKEVGGFPESGMNSAEDTDFNYLISLGGYKIVRAREAIVEWSVPSDVTSFSKKIFNYAKWDSKKGIWWHPVQRFKTHNLKVLMVFARYGLGLILLLVGWYYLFFIAIGLYMVRSFFKAGYFRIFLQIWVDILVMSGFLNGLIKK